MHLNQLIAHRGASAYAPENTMAAFNKALAMGASWVEFDVMLSADGVPYVFHDDSLKRITRHRGGFGETESDIINQLDAGSWFSKSFKQERIPTFLDVLKWLTFTGMNANIEIKPYPSKEEQTATAVLSMLNRYWPMGRDLPLVSSFDWQVLRLCHALSPELPLGLLMHEWNEKWHQEALSLNVYSVHVYHRILTPERAKEIKDAGFKLCVYTVNKKRLAKKLFNLGVDAIFSDYPDLLCD